MIQLDPGERAMLTRAKKGPLRIKVRDRGQRMAETAPDRDQADWLVNRGLLTFAGYEDVNAYEVAVYSITTAGRYALDIVSGRFRLDRDDAAHPGCS